MKPTDLRVILQYIPQFREKTFIIAIDGAIVTDENFSNILLDVAVLPHSNRFGSPLVLFEFMACGLPIVAPRLDPITDVLRDGMTGLLFDPLDLGQMVEAITTLLESAELRRRLGDTARHRVRAEHTWEQNAAAILRLGGFEQPVAREEVFLAS